MAKTITVEEATSLMVQRIVSLFGPERIILFGSQARGDMDEDSDVDLLVVLPECQDRKAATIAMMKALADLPVSKDILVTSTSEIETRGKLVSTVLYPALREGRVLYAR